MLTQFGFRRKMLYLCTSEEERAYKQRVFSSFFGLKDGEFTSEVEKFTLLRKIFLGVCGKFFRNVGARGSVYRSVFRLVFIKEVKVFRPKNFDFNSSSNYSGQSNEGSRE